MARKSLNFRTVTKTLKSVTVTVTIVKIQYLGEIFISPRQARECMYACMFITVGPMKKL